MSNCKHTSRQSQKTLEYISCLACRRLGFPQEEREVVAMEKHICIFFCNQHVGFRIQEGFFFTAENIWKEVKDNVFLEVTATTVVTMSATKL